jgi:ABC-type antimicrobial peptide transport system permease subunit
VAGREFEFEDESRSRVAIVNQAMARYYFGDRSPIGKHVTFEGQDRPYEIVGLVGDAKYFNLHDAAPRTVYLNAFQDARGSFHQVVLRTNGAPTTVVGNVRLAVRDVLKNVPVTKVTTLADQVDASIVPERLIAVLSGFFGGLGALLAAIGLYGLLAYTVARRTNEIGIRMALGATERDVTRMVLKGALGLVCAGLVVGAPIAVSSKRFAASVIENLPVDSAFSIAFAAAAMIGVALLAAYVPARRAARVDPMEALRHE